MGQHIRVDIASREVDHDRLAPQLLQVLARHCQSDGTAGFYNQFESIGSEGYRLQNIVIACRSSFYAARLKYGERYRPRCRGDNGVADRARLRVIGNPLTRL